MTFLLDTNIVIFALSGRRHETSERLDRELANGTDIGISSIVLFELRFGIAKSQHGVSSKTALNKFLEAPIEIIPFDETDAAHAGDIRAHLERQGTPIGPYDLLIAAQARARNATLVTANTREFERVPGLKLTDWS